MIDGRNINPECYADTLLISLMGFERPHHKLGIGEVADEMKRMSVGRVAVGMVDDDNRIPDYFKAFETESLNNYFIFKYLPQQKRYLLVVTPAFERCMFNIAEALEVNPEKYGFKSEQQFRAITKNRNVHNNQNVKQFLNTLIQKKASPLQDVKTWIVEKLNE